MNMRSIVVRTVALAGFLLAAFAGFLHAQQPRGGTVKSGPAGRAVGVGYEGPMTDVLKIRRLEGLGRAMLVRTPEYRTSHPGPTKPAQDWCEIRVTFDTAPEWIDETVFQFYVLTYERKEREAPYSFYQATVRYVDIEKGRGHMGCVYLPPPALKRYGYPVAIGVEILINGKVVDSASERDGTVRIAEGWWKNPNVIGKDIVVSRQGYLLNRKETPFALVNVDDHEVIR